MLTRIKSRGVNPVATRTAHLILLDYAGDVENARERVLEFTNGQHWFARQIVSEMERLTRKPRKRKADALKRKPFAPTLAQRDYRKAA